MILKNRTKKTETRFIKTAAMALIVVAFVFLSPAPSFAADEKPQLIAHGGGFIEGFYTTNSVEAVMQSIAQGFQLIELDMCYSSDGKIIMIHDWDRTVRHYFGTTFTARPTEREFEQLLVNGRFQTLTFNRLVKILDEAEDIRIVTDVKGDNIKVLTMIVEQFPDHMHRMIPQIYSYEEYDLVRALGFDDIILTLYSKETIDYDELIHFINTSNLFAVAVGSTHEYIIEGLKFKLANDGVVVYYHPVRDFETAISVMEQGVHGVFASRIMPADFEEPARSYHLLHDGVKLRDATLTEKTFGALRNVLIRNGAGKTVSYLINGEPVTDELIATLEEGRHELTVVLTLDEEVVAELDYLLWAGVSYLRILDKRYEFRMNQFRRLPDMRQTLEDGEVSEEIKGILLRSLVVKAGRHYGYNNGELLTFHINEEFLHTQRYTNGFVLSPFADSMMALGAEAIRMDEGRYVYVYYNGTRTMLQAHTSFIRPDAGRSSRLRTPLTIFRNRIMAPGEAFKMITGRDYMDNRELMILLPANAEARNIDADEIFSAASLLFTTFHCKQTMDTV